MNEMKLLWGDPRQLSLEKKLVPAATHFRDKFGIVPTVVYAHGNTLGDQTEILVTLPPRRDIKARVVRFVTGQRPGSQTITLQLFSGTSISPDHFLLRDKKFQY